MKNYGIKVLFGILIIGVTISIVALLLNALEASIAMLGLTSLLLFVISVILLISSFKFFSKKISLWFILLLSSPLAINALSNLTYEAYLGMIDTTTPKEFAYQVKVDSSRYNSDKIRLQNLVDSLIEIKTIQYPSELALRSFDGKDYYDTIERSRAIDLNLALEYKENFIDTLFYSENGEEIIAGLLISKVYNEYKNYPRGGIDFRGTGFRFDKQAKKPFQMLKYSFSGYDSYETCSKGLRHYYLKKIGTWDNEYNMNDLRFLNNKEN